MNGAPERVMMGKQKLHKGCGLMPVPARSPRQLQVTGKTG